MVKKSMLLLLGLISITTFQETRPEFDWTVATVLGLAPFMYYLHSKDPKMDPPTDAITDRNHPKFWTKSNLWKFFDQVIIGQRFKPKSEKLGERKIKFAPKDCWPKGILGNLDAYIIGVGSRAAKPLQVIFNLLTANRLKQVLIVLK